MKTTFMISGKRKSAVAKARVSVGNGNVTFNGTPLENLYLFHKLAIQEPLRVFEHVIGKIPIDLRVTATGGGAEGQIQAARLAIAKALVKHTKSVELKKAYLQYDRNLLVADIRRKEAYKPGDSKARAKRQKSYR